MLREEYLVHLNHYAHNPKNSAHGSCGKECFPFSWLGRWFHLSAFGSGHSEMIGESPDQIRRSRPTLWPSKLLFCWQKAPRKHQKALYNMAEGSTAWPETSIIGAETQQPRATAVRLTTLRVTSDKRCGFWGGGRAAGRQGRAGLGRGMKNNFGRGWGWQRHSLRIPNPPCQDCKQGETGVAPLRGLGFPQRKRKAGLGRGMEKELRRPQHLLPLPQEAEVPITALRLLREPVSTGSGCRLVTDGLLSPERPKAYHHAVTMTVVLKPLQEAKPL